MYALISKCKNKWFFIIAFSLPFFAKVQAQTLIDYSVLPVNMNTSADLTPNVLFILDSSGSMRANSNNSHIGAHSPASRSFAVRSVLRNLLNSNIGEMNVSFMTFGGQSNPINRWVNVANCGGFNPGDCPGNVARISGRSLTGRGVLLSNMGLLDNAKRNEINGIIATEPQLPVGGENWWNSWWGFHPANGSIFSNGVLLSGGGTPLTGTLQTGYRYLVNRSILGDEAALFNGGAVTYPAAITTAQCTARTYVFLITDGVPTVNQFGAGVNSNAEIFNTAVEAAALRAAGVDVFVFGFQVDGNAANMMNQISQAGSGQNAFISNNATTLQGQIQSAIESIKVPKGSSSGVSIVENSTQAAGAIVHALYEPTIGSSSASNDDTVNWVGYLNAFFIDRYGYIREDAGNKGKLDGYNVDRAFTLEYVEIPGADGQKEVRASRLNITGLGTPNFQESVAQDLIPISDLNSIWSADRELSKPYASSNSGNQAAIANLYGTVNRNYNSVASNSNGYRRIYSWIQSDLSPQGSGDTGQQYDNGRQIEFLYRASTNSNTINNSNYTLLGVNSPAEADRIIRFIRGQENISGFRNRSLDGNTYLLGDIIHSTAVQVGSPKDTSFTRFKNSAYDSFKQAHENRRRMVYVGGNDGLLHAFNAGFWDGANTQFNLTSANDSTAHNLGAEMWAYAPMNLLPHLKWLTRTEYDSSVHVAYMDGPIKVFDVQAFDPNDTSNGKVQGWGTILVAGMRLGGGDYPNVDPDANPNTNNSFTARSAYIVMDITDPSQEPKVIAEITHEDLNFTTSTPEIMKNGNDWYLVFGSGPNDLKTATVTPGSGQNPGVFFYKLNYNDRGFLVSAGKSKLEANSDEGFVGNPVATDWDNDGSDDAVYFGTISGTEANADGALYRYINQGTQSGSIRLLLDTNRPVVDKPFLKHYEGFNWVFFGTARYLSDADELNQQQNTFYGVIENNINQTINRSDLLNISNVNVSTTGKLTPNVEGFDNFLDLRNSIINNQSIKGWYTDYFSHNPSVKNSASAFSYSNLLFYTYYRPSARSATQTECEPNPLGESYIDIVDLATGLPFYAVDYDGALGSSQGNLVKSASIGEGYTYQSYLLVGPDKEGGDDNKGTIKTPLGTGAINNLQINLPTGSNGGEGRTSWREIQSQ